MALPSTLHHIALSWSLADLGIVGDVSLRVARHPSETMERLWLRVLAYAWKWREGITFGPGLCDPDAPDLLVEEPGRRAALVVRVGRPDPVRVERDVNQNAGAEVAVLFEGPRRITSTWRWTDGRSTRRCTGRPCEVATAPDPAATFRDGGPGSPLTNGQRTRESRREGEECRMRAASWLCLLALGCASAPARTDPADRDPLLHRAAVNGTELAYTVEGAGPPLVIIHGWLSDYRSFSQVAAVVARSRTVVRLSLRLHHPNPWPGSARAAAETYRVENHAADVAALIQRLGLGPADVVGHSYGGIVAALLARAHPELVRSLILIEPSLFGLIHDRRVGAETLSGFEDGRMRTLAQLAAGKPALDVIREIFGPEAFDQFGALRRQIIVDNANTLAPSQAESWWALPFSCADARAFGMPVQLIEGAATFAAAREIQQELLRCVNDGQRVVIPRAGHTVQFDAPEATGRAILRFVTGGS